MLTQDPSLKELAFTKSLSILLISCPCALGIAAPLAESALMSALVSLGIIVRNRGALAEISKQTCFVFDKTGTLTHGALCIKKGLDSLGNEDKRALKALVKVSFHPICKSIENAISLNPLDLEDFQEVIGQGIKGQDKEGNEYLLGSFSFLKTLGVDFIEEGNHNQILSYFVKNQKVVTTLFFEDTLRPSARDLFTYLKDKKKVILSGDRESVVAAISRELGSCPFKFECLPLQKKEHIQNYQNQGDKVCFVGDGVNDAPSITRADLGISMLRASDISIQVSDIFITKEDLSLIAKMIELSKKGTRALKQNLFWAFFYNVLGIILAISGLLLPLYAAFAMVASSLIVCFNSLRIKRT